jgi:hypothetical protein
VLQRSGTKAHCGVSSLRNHREKVMTNKSTRDELGFYESLDDGWARIFALMLGTRQPNKAVKKEFAVFVEKELKKSNLELMFIAEDDILNYFTEFLEYLMDGKEASQLELQLLNKKLKTF